MKNKFLNELEKELYALNTNELNEILDFYKERIENCTYEGKSEEEVIKELEDPKTISTNIYKEFGIDASKMNKKVEVVKGEDRLASILKLGAVIFVDLAVIIPILVGIIAAVLSVFAAGIGAGIGMPFATIISEVSMVEKVLYTTAGITTGIFVTYLGLLGVEFAVIAIKNVIAMHMRVFNASTKKVKKVLRASVIRKRGKFSFFFKSLTGLTAVTALVAILSVGGMFLIDGHIKRSVFNEEYLNEVMEFNEEVGAEANVIINSNSEIKITTVAVDEIRVVNKYDRSNNTDISANIQENNTYNIDVNTDKEWIDYIKMNREVVEIFIPETVESLTINATFFKIDLENLEVGELKIAGNSGDIELNKISYEKIDIDLSNGDVDLENMTTINENSSIDIKLNNGDVDFEDIEVKRLNLSLNNGDVDIKNVNNVTKVDNSSLTIETSVGDIDLEEVYLSKVVIELTVGRVEFENDNKSYTIDHDISVVTGRKEISVG